MSKSLEQICTGLSKEAGGRLLRHELMVRIARELDGGKNTPQELRDLAAALRHLDSMDV